jgi:hypothetical protein
MILVLGFDLDPLVLYNTWLLREQRGGCIPNLNSGMSSMKIPCSLPSSTIGCLYNYFKFAARIIEGEISVKPL